MERQDLCAVPNFTRITRFPCPLQEYCTAPVQTHRGGKPLGPVTYSKLVQTVMMFLGFLYKFRDVSNREGRWQM